MDDEIFFDADGTWSQARWVDYWQSLWSAPTQPGYATLVREGLAALVELTRTLEGAADAAGNPGARTAAVEARAALIPFTTIAAATNDGDTLKTLVVDPLLTQGNQPLLQIGLIQPMIAGTRSRRGWIDLFTDTIVKPTKRVVTSVGTSARGFVLSTRVQLIAAAAFVAWLVLRDR